MTVSVYIGAGAGGRMTGGFHARETLMRVPRRASVCPLTDTRTVVSGVQAGTLHDGFLPLVCVNEKKKL